MEQKKVREKDTKKDSKNRNLKQNESQMSDGRYRYRYTDKYGKRNAVYAWKLVPTDKTPVGKKEDLSLREKIKNIEKDIDDGIDILSSQITVGELIKRYLNTKATLANATKNNYFHIYEKNIEPHGLNSMRICDVKRSHILSFYSYLYKERDFKVSTIQLYQNLLYPAFQMAVDDDLIRKNPCKNCMKEYVRGSLSSTKVPLSRIEQNNLLSFLKKDNIYSQYYILVAFMLSTGCRIGEALGITWHDIHLDKKYIDINHQIIYKKVDGRIRFYSALPKNKTFRQIPIQDDIVALLKKHKENMYFMSLASGFEVEGYVVDGRKVDDFRNFVFMNRQDKVYTPNTIVRAFHGIRDAYNKIEEDRAFDEKVTPQLLPDFTPHTLRHTFCTRNAENKMDVRVLQEIMGHKNIAITMQVYNHASIERIQKEVEATESALIVSL